LTRVCALVLAAGEGVRLRPLTETLPKALCPVGNRPLLDRALDRLARHGLAGPDAVAVNACYLADAVAGHLGARAHLSVEPGPPALGTAGAVAHLRAWTAGRGLLVGNSDAYLAPRVPGSADLTALLDGWDGSTVRVLAVPAESERAVEFRAAGLPPMRFAGFSLLPADVIAELPEGRAELVLAVWRPAERAGRLEVIPYDGVYLDTGTPATYLAANLHAAGVGSLIAPDAVIDGSVAHSVVGAGARVRGTIARTVVLPGGSVGPDEHLVDAIRQGDDVTVPAAGPTIVS
jgi:NDP-sugar pyrophosphorylase family protein